MAVIEIDGVATEVVELACDFIANGSVREVRFRTNLRLSGAPLLSFSTAHLSFSLDGRIHRGTFRLSGCTLASGQAGYRYFPI